MKRKLVLISVIVIFLASLLTFAYRIEKVQAIGTIYIRADGSIDPPTANIQRNGDFYTFTGNITDHIVIERDNMTLNGMGFTSGSVQINMRNNITVRNALPIGIVVSRSINVSIIETLSKAITVRYSNNTKLVSNKVEAWSGGHGILFEQCNNNTLIENVSTDASHGYYIRITTNNTLYGNVATNCSDTGLTLDQTYSSILRNNSMIDNKHNFYVHGVSLSQHIHDIDTSNTVDGKLIYYLINERDLTLNNSITDIGYLGVVNSTSIRVQNLTLINNGQGVLFAYVMNSTIESCISANNRRGIELRFSDNNFIIGNTVIDSWSDGIHIWDWLGGDGSSYGFGGGGSKYGGNVVVKNTVTRSGASGVAIWYADDNNITRNTATSNENSGIYLRFTNKNSVVKNELSTNTRGIHNYWSSHNNIIGNNVINSLSYALHFEKWSIENTIFHNNFINSSEQAYIFENIDDAWNKGYPAGGNYWSDYNGTDLFSGPYQNETGSDGIGDNPYHIDENNQDNYPLICDWVPISSHNTTFTKGGETYPIEVISNATIIDFMENPGVIKLKVSGQTGTSGYVRVIQPVGLNSSNIKVFLNNTKLTFPSTDPPRSISTNGTHYFIYFTFTFNSSYELTMAFPIVGDVDYNGKVDIFDVVLACSAYLSTPIDPYWNPHCDVAAEYGVINIFDVVLVVGHYGDEWN